MTNQKYLSVTDSSATAEYPVREHHVMLDGELQAVTFEYGKATILPYELGAKFLLAGFKVKDADENELKLPSLEAAVMAEDEVIARLSELTDDALLLRAISKVGGEQFMDSDAPRSAVIAFLIAKPAEDDDIEDVELVDEDEDGDVADVADNAVEFEKPQAVVDDESDLGEVDVADEGLSDEEKAAQQQAIEAAQAEAAAKPQEDLTEKEIVANDEGSKA